MLHQLCHSRIPFTAERYAETAGLRLRDARGILGQARAKGWVIELPRTDPRLYNGLLPKR